MPPGHDCRYHTLFEHCSKPVVPAHLVAPLTHPVGEGEGDVVEVLVGEAVVLTEEVVLTGVVVLIELLVVGAGPFGKSHKAAPLES